MPIWRLLEYLETLLEYYHIRHEGLSFDALVRKLEYLEQIRKAEGQRPVIQL